MPPSTTSCLVSSSAGKPARSSLAPRVDMAQLLQIVTQAAIQAALAAIHVTLQVQQALLQTLQTTTIDQPIGEQEV